MLTVTLRTRVSAALSQQHTHTQPHHALKGVVGILKRQRELGRCRGHAQWLHSPGDSCPGRPSLGATPLHEERPPVLRFVLPGDPAAKHTINQPHSATNRSFDTYM